MPKEITILKLSKGFLISYIKGFDLKREAEMKESDAINRIKELLKEEDDN